MNTISAFPAAPDAPTPAGMRIRTLSLCLMAALGGGVAQAAWNAPHADTHVQTPNAPRNTIAVTNCNASGAGSFAQAIIDANSGDLIDMTTLTCSTISLTDGALFITDGSLDIDGPGRSRLTIEDASSTHTGLLRHTGTGGLYIRGVTLSGGRKYTNGGDALGGCLYSAGTVRLHDVTITGCTASGGSHAALGGAVFAEGGVIITDSTVSGSTATSISHYASGGGIYTNGNLYMNRVTIDANEATSDTWHSFAGGAFTRGRGMIYDSTISNNAAEHDAGLALAPVIDVDQHVVGNTTISYNAASWNGGVSVRGDAYFYSDTIAFNSALNTYNGSEPVGAGLHISTEDQVFIYSTIIAQNMAAGLPWDIGAISPAASPVMTNCLIRAAAPNVTLSPFNIDADPLLGPLVNNGGTTKTHALRSGSPAIDNGNNVEALTYDQRGFGFPRVRNSQADIGAYEFDSDLIFRYGFE